MRQLRSVSETRSKLISYQYRTWAFFTNFSAEGWKGSTFPPKTIHIVSFDLPLVSIHTSRPGVLRAHATVVRSAVLSVTDNDPASCPLFLHAQSLLRNVDAATPTTAPVDSTQANMDDVNDTLRLTDYERSGTYSTRPFSAAAKASITRCSFLFYSFVSANRVCTILFPSRALNDQQHTTYNTYKKCFS